MFCLYFSDLSYTKISSIPLNGLRRTIKYLDLDGCKNIHRFPVAEGLLFDKELCTNKTFPFLQSIRFEYHAHCCLYSDFKPFASYSFLLPNTITRQCSETDNRKRSISLKETKRSSTNHTCINLQDGTTVSNYMPTDNEVYTLEAFCDLTTYCFDNHCPSNCIAIESSGSGVSQEMSGIACIANEELFVSSSSPTQTFSHDITSFIPIPTTTISIGVSNSITTTTVCWKGTSIITDFSASASPAVASSDENCCTTIEISLAQTSTEHIMCPSVTVEQSTVQSTTMSPSTIAQSTIISTISSPTSTPPPITECHLYADAVLEESCIFCQDDDCEPLEDCEQFLPVCNAEKRRKRSLSCLTKDCRSSECREFEDLCLAKRQKRNADISTTCSTCMSAMTSSGSGACSTNIINIMPSISFSLVCSSEVLSTSGLPSASFSQPSSSTVPSPTNTPPAITECHMYTDPVLEESCIFCQDDDCEPLEDCEQFLPVCNAEKRRKRSLDCVASNCSAVECKEFEHLCFGSRLKRNVASASACGGCSVSIVTSFVEILPTTTRYSSSSSTQQSPSSSTSGMDILSHSANANQGTQSTTAYCTPPILLSPAFYYEIDVVTDCYPNNDPFNPCFHILDDDILRASIWIVLLIAIFGNGLVIIVTLLHWMFKYKSHREGPDLLYVLYLNLAIADLFMGFYLITIAAADIDTKGHYSEEAIDWQTGPGCVFAGFCAIFSSILSVYTLLIITTERVYSIKFALQKKRFKKHWVFLLMLFGWVLALLLAILPMVGLSSYERVSICLPFENRETKDKVYIAFTLAITGVASFFIFFSYVYLFYIVGCSANKRLLKKSMSGREEMKLAFRMSLLIFTDFATWAPIALFGLTAAFGYPLINDIKAAKVLMVFVFPLNSCLNPILYSFSTRLFRNNVLNMLKKCGLQGTCDQWSKSFRISTTDKPTSFDSTNDDIGKGHNRRRRSTQMSILSRLASVSSLGSGGEHNGSRRGSTLSGSSNEGLPITIENKSNGLTSPRSLVKSSWDSTGSLTNTARLKALPEENETDVNHISLEIHRKNSTGSNCSTSFSSSTPPLGKLSNGSTRRQSLPTILDQDSQDNPLQHSGTLRKNHVSNGLILTNKRVAYDDEIEVTVF